MTGDELHDLWRALLDWRCGIAHEMRWAACARAGVDKKQGHTAAMGRHDAIINGQLR